MKKWLIVIVMALVAAVAWKELAKRGIGPSMNVGGEMHNPLPPESPLYAQQQEFVDRFNADPALRERFAGRFSSKGLYAELTTALRRGGQSLDAAVLVKGTTAMAAMLPRLPEQSCAKLIRPRDDFDRELSADIGATLERLPPKHHRNLWELYLQALKAEVDDAPVRPRDRAAEEAAWRLLGETYNASQAERIVGVLKSPARASDEDACWAINTMTHGASLLPPGSAEAFSRAMWAGN